VALLPLQVEVHLLAHVVHLLHQEEVLLQNQMLLHLILEQLVSQKEEDANHHLHQKKALEEKQILKLQLSHRKQNLTLGVVLSKQSP
jgi:hypothetical protein